MTFTEKFKRIEFYSTQTSLADKNFYVYINGKVQRESASNANVTEVSEPIPLSFQPYVHSRGNNAPYLKDLVSLVQV